MQFNNLNQTCRLALGTAQLGMKYGIANKSGRPDSDLAMKIVQTAWEGGIKIYDTAQGYGESERALGKALKSLGLTSDANIITKLDPNVDHIDKMALEQAVKESLSRLNVRILHGLMLHREEYLELWEKGLGEILQSFIEKGLTKHIGVSVYSPEGAMLAVEKDEINMIQIPSNILDRRFEKAGVFALAQRRGKEIYIRSVFLQGLILMKAEDLPENMQFAIPILNNLGALSQQTGLSKQDLALGYVGLAFPETKVIFGAETSSQVEDNMKSWKRTLPVGFVERVQEEFGYVEERILNPALWPN